MSESSSLREEFIEARDDKEYRHGYAEESLNISIATQIKVLREQREMSQGDLAQEAGMKQPVISRYENVNYSSWSISSLRRLARVFDVYLEVKFRSFGELVKSVEGFNRKALQVPKFEDDLFFREAENTLAAESAEKVFKEERTQSSVRIPPEEVSLLRTLSKTGQGQVYAQAEDVRREYPMIGKRKERSKLETLLESARAA